MRLVSVDLQLANFTVPRLIAGFKFSGRLPENAASAERANHPPVEDAS
jgi:hypothetical protein